jgi:hypothetical protein
MFHSVHRVSASCRMQFAAEALTSICQQLQPPRLHSSHLGVQLHQWHCGQVTEQQQQIVKTQYSTGGCWSEMH